MSLQTIKPWKVGREASHCSNIPGAAAPSPRGMAGGEASSLSLDPLYPYCLGAVWLYVVLLVFEGALRKWLLPSLATPLLLVREPIVVWLVCVALARGWIGYGWVKAMMFVATLSLVLSLLFGHHNVLVALYGWRIYFFHFPMMFVMGRLLSRRELLRVCRFFVWLSVPMTMLIVVQFYSPQDAWVNIGVGGEGTAGFAGAAGFMRPPGTFSFTSGYVAFQSVVGCVLLYYLVANGSLAAGSRLPRWLLAVALVCYVVAIPTSISRTNFFQTAVFLAFLLSAAVFSSHYRAQAVRFVVVGVVAVALLAASGLLETNVEVFAARFEGANEAEGGVEGVLLDRYLGGLIGALVAADIPLLGYGLGIGTNVGARLMGGNMYSFGFNGEVEWQRIVGECGFVLGVTIILMRLLFGLKMLQKAWLRLRDDADLLPWMLAAGMILCVPQGQWGIPTNLGFCVLLGGMTLAAIRTTGAGEVTSTASRQQTA